MPKTFIIAEAGVNHNVSLKLAYKLCDAAKHAGADAVKFQTWITDKIMTPDNPRYEMLKSLEMPFSFFRDIKQYCTKLGIMFLSTPDDEESLDFLVDELDMTIIKIGSGNLTNHKFIFKASQKKKNIILSIGMSHIPEINQSLQIIYSNYPQIDLTLLHCVSLYPTKYEEINLKVIESLKNLYVCKVGLSDHTLGIDIPIAAVALGALVIEKHLTMDKNLPGPDHALSLDPAEFKQMVKSIRNVEVALGDGIKIPCSRELEIRDLYRIKCARL